MLQRIDTRQHDVRSELDALRARLSPQGDVVSEAGRRKTIEVFGEPLSPQQVVKKICDDVRSDGLSSLLDYCHRLDGAQLTLSADRPTEVAGSDELSLRVSSDMMQRAHEQEDPALLDSVRRIRDNIFEFQSALKQQDIEVRRPGVHLQQRYLPLERIGICVPGGAAAYPSTVLMTAVPAQAAGVDQIAVVALPTPFGANNSTVLATCWELGIREVYRVGGAQAVAALAYGVQGLPKVDKIVGPGNMFVALAKQHVFGTVDIDSIAGPSEVVVVADQSTRPDFTASDLLAQAEHAPGSSILISWSQQLLDETDAELQRQVSQLSRCQLTLDSLKRFGAAILVRDADEACSLCNELAPEHLHLAIDEAEPLLAKIRHAGATFVGNYSPVALGDYVAGPSHVLPTGGTARWAAGLTANDFLRGGSVIQYTQQALREVVDDVRRLADREGLTAHRASVDIRT